MGEYGTIRNLETNQEKKIAAPTIQLTSNFSGESFLATLPSYSVVKGGRSHADSVVPKRPQVSKDCLQGIIRY